MKNKQLIIISSIIGFVLLASLGVYFYVKKQKKNTEPDTAPTPEVIPDNNVKVTNSDQIEAMKKLQKKINEVLPAGYEKLSVDGVYGDKTKKAFQYLTDNNIGFKEVEYQKGQPEMQKNFSNRVTDIPTM